MGKRKLTISIDENLWKDVHQKKAETGVSISHVVSKALEKWCEWELFLSKLRIMGQEEEQ
jgi:hypothetical protein